MKRIFSFLLILIACKTTVAQNVGIGTISPNSKAMLDISSNTKGVLIPRMTTSERFAIATPPNGLMVFDTDKNEIHQYAGGSWTSILNGNYWSRPITSRNRIANANDSVGIGTVSPTEWLDVDGNIRTRSNLIADNRGIFTGDLTTNSDLIVDNTSATLQLKSSGVSKGYFQLSGNNVRMGTNSGNSTGNLIIRMNGNDRITINPAGNIDLDGQITRNNVTGTSPLLPVCYGYIYFDGTILSGTGNFTVNRTSEGNYSITCNALNIYSIILLTTSTADRVAGQYQSSPTTFDVTIRSLSASGHPFRDDVFSFIAYKPN